MKNEKIIKTLDELKKLNVTLEEMATIIHPHTRNRHDMAKQLQYAEQTGLLYIARRLPEKRQIITLDAYEKKPIDVVPEGIYITHNVICENGLTGGSNGKLKPREAIKLSSNEQAILETGGSVYTLIDMTCCTKFNGDLTKDGRVRNLANAIDMSFEELVTSRTESLAPRVKEYIDRQIVGEENGDRLRFSKDITDRITLLPYISTHFRE